jgi:membrane protein required for colicin V production
LRRAEQAVELQIPKSEIRSPQLFITVLDYFVLIVVVASVASGATRGILKGIISVASALAGLVLAAHFYAYAAIPFGAVKAAAQWSSLLGFVTIFVAILAAGGLLSYWLRSRLRHARLSWVDHLMGAGFGLLRGWLICSVVYLALTAFPVRPVAVDRALLGPVLLEGTRVIVYLTSQDMRQRFSSGYETVKRLWGQNEAA